MISLLREQGCGKIVICGTRSGDFGAISAGVRITYKANSKNCRETFKRGDWETRDEKFTRAMNTIVEQASAKSAKPTLPRTCRLEYEKWFDMQNKVITKHVLNGLITSGLLKTVATETTIANLHVQAWMLRNRRIADVGFGSHQRQVDQQVPLRMNDSSGLPSFRVARSMSCRSWAPKDLWY
ncbi:hypothetical protein NKDENANG_03332 [Candidatus Entotheonellaceae bacterium PAL068K]